MIDSQHKNKKPRLPLPFCDTEEVILNAADYERDEANDILVHIPADTEGFTAFTTLDITLKKLSTSDTPVDLLECWIDWPPTEQPAGWGVNPREALEGKHPEKLPMILRDIDGQDNVEVFMDPDKEKATLRATTIRSSTLRVKFKVPNVFYNLPGRPPYVRKRLTVNLRVLNGAASSVLQLEYPKSIAMRARADNAEYQSLVFSVDDDYFRKTTFFPQREIHIRYTFGTTNGTELSAPGFPPLRAGLILLGFGITLLLVDAVRPTGDEGLFEIAAVIFGLTFIPSFVEIFRMRLLSHSAAVADKVSWDRLSTYIFSGVHFGALCFVALTLLLVDLPEKRPEHIPALVGRGLGFFLVGGLLVFGAWILYFIPLGLGTFHKYMCDRCERRTWIRKWLPMGLGAYLYDRRLTTKLHHATRHSLCARCYDEVSKEHLENPGEDKLHSRSQPEHPGGRKTTSKDGHASARRAAASKSEPGTTVEEFPDREQSAWKNVLGRGVEVDPLPKFVDSRVVQTLEEMYLEPRFIPSLDLGEIDNDVRDYLKELHERYPEWKNTRKLYWELVKDKKFAFPALPGQWVAVEVEEKPELGGKYPRTPLAVELGFDKDRFNVSWNSIQDAIEREKQRILSDIGLPPERTDLRLLEALEWNLLANREGWGKTRTWEWTNTRFRGDGHMRVSVVGNSAHGGAGCMGTRSLVNSDNHIGFRPVIVIGLDELNA